MGHRSQVNGHASLTYKSTGAVCVVEIPLSQPVMEPERDATAA
jgi:hypothetical protein